MVSTNGSDNVPPLLRAKLLLLNTASDGSETVPPLLSVTPPLLIAVSQGSHSPDPLPAVKVAHALASTGNFTTPLFCAIR